MHVPKHLQKGSLQEHSKGFKATGKHCKNNNLLQAQKTR